MSTSKRRPSKRKTATTPKLLPQRFRINRSTNRFGIRNPLGGIWTSETFQTEAEAQDYLDQQKTAWPNNGLSAHRVVRVRVTISEIKS